MDLAAIDWRARLRRRFPAALLGAQLWLTGTWLTTLSATCFESTETVTCPGIGNPAAPAVLAIGGVVGLLGWALALVVPSRWFDALGDAVPTIESVRRARGETHLVALLFLGVAAVVIPRLFLGQLGLSGLSWVVAAAPAAPALLLLFGSLALAMLAGPLLGDVSGLVALVFALFLLLLASVLQVALYYGIAAGLRRLVVAAGRRLGSPGAAAEGE